MRTKRNLNSGSVEYVFMIYVAALITNSHRSLHIYGPWAFCRVREEIAARIQPSHSSERQQLAIQAALKPK